jgi:hypothetical protein
LACLIYNAMICCLPCDYSVSHGSTSS